MSPQADDDDTDRSMASAGEQSSTAPDSRQSNVALPQPSSLLLSTTAMNLGTLLVLAAASLPPVIQSPESWPALPAVLVLLLLTGVFGLLIALSHAFRNRHAARVLAVLYALGSALTALAVLAHLGNTIIHGSSTGSIDYAIILACVGLIIAAYLVFCGWLALRWSRRLHFANLDRQGLCRQCGYNLHGLPEPRCPECGLPFDPERAPAAPDSSG